jgi:hypothetical protein
MLKTVVPCLVAGLLFATPAFADVACVQQGLTDLGFDPGPVDGALGKKTVTAATLFAANAGITMETLTKENSDAWCTQITAFQQTPEAQTISHLDLVSEPEGILSERNQTRLWDAYKTAKECFEHPTYGEGFGFKLPALKVEAFAAEWTSPFTAVTGAPECQVDPGRLQPPKPIASVTLDESYGERVESVDAAATWFRQLATYHRYSNDPVALELLQTALVDWAKAGGLGKGIHVSWGAKPVDYQMIATILSFTAAAAQVAPSLSADDRAIVGPWLNDLVRQVAASHWKDREDNKQYMRTYTALLWGLTVGDDRPVQNAIFEYKLAIHDMRPDGSWPIDSQRGGMGLHYNSAAASHIVLIAAALKHARNLDLFSYEVDGRSIHDAIDWVVYSLQDPAAANSKYAIACPDGGDRFGSTENPSLSHVEEAGYLLAYASLFPDRESSKFIAEYYAGREAPESEKNGGPSACHFALAGGTVDLPPLEMPDPPPEMPAAKSTFYPEHIEENGSPDSIDANLHMYGRIDGAKLAEIDFNLQPRSYAKGARNFLKLQMIVNMPLSQKELDALEACKIRVERYDDDKPRLILDFKKEGDAFVSTNGACVVDAISGDVRDQAQFLLTSLQDIAISLVAGGEADSLKHDGTRVFLERVALGEISVKM